LHLASVLPALRARKVRLLNFFAHTAIVGEPRCFYADTPRLVDFKVSSD